MINTLYKCFQHWSEKGSIYIISDPHFSDIDMNWRWSLINDYPFVVLDWLDENDIASNIADYIVWKINKFVHKNDTLIILGDIGDKSYINSLRAGYKILICGNHDRGVSYYKDVFDEVYEGPLMISDKIILSHEPIDLSYMFSIHGHQHNIKLDKFNSNHYNCVVEKNDFEPISLSKLIKDGFTSKVENIHRLTIDNATERCKNKGSD